MFVVLLISAIFVFLFAYQQWKRSKLPPGPYPFPIIGNLPQIAKMSKRHRGIVGAMREWTKEYGPIFTIWMGPLPTVHICIMELAMETMVKRGNEFSDRWVQFLFNVVRKGLGIVGTSGDHWLEHRRFAIHVFKNFGVGRGLIEEKIMEEFNFRAKALDEQIGDKNMEMDPKPFFDMMVGSINNRILFNEPLDEITGAEFYKHKNDMDEFFEKLSFFDFLLNEHLAKLPIIRDRLRKMTEPQQGVADFLRNQVMQRIQLIESGDHIISDNPECYVDAFFQKMKEEERMPESSFDVDNLVINLQDLWIAGQETSAITIVAGIGYLLNNLEILTNVRNEILEVTGGERHLSMKDKPNTPYLNATILEIQRHASILNLNLFRCTREDTVIGGYPVAKGTPLTAEISVLMSDEQYFKDSDKFDPSRFLKDGHLEKHVVAFGLGKRACLGESLARAELYLILGNMMHRYQMEPSDILPSISQVNDTGIMKRISHYTMKIRKID